MHRHNDNLSAEDRKAIDVLLDQGASTADGGVIPHTPAASPKNLLAASKVLQLLSQLPEVDPPADLVSRTMGRIDQDIADRALRREARRRPAAPHVH